MPSNVPLTPANARSPLSVDPSTSSDGTPNSAETDNPQPLAPVEDPKTGFPVEDQHFVPPSMLKRVKWPSFSFSI